MLRQSTSGLATERCGKHDCCSHQNKNMVHKHICGLNTLRSNGLKHTVNRELSHSKAPAGYPCQYNEGLQQAHHCVRPLGWLGDSKPEAPGENVVPGRGSSDPLLATVAAAPAAAAAAALMARVPGCTRRSPLQPCCMGVLSGRTLAVRRRDPR